MRDMKGSAGFGPAFPYEIQYYSVYLDSGLCAFWSCDIASILKASMLKGV